MVGIVHKRKWVKSSSEKFSSYINYIDREEVVRNYKLDEYSLFNDYMGNPKKCGNLFTSDRDFLSEDESKKLKRCFSIAQENGSFMWQDVFSFDNEWLEKYGMYDRRTGALDEKRLMEAVRNSMTEMIHDGVMSGLGKNIWLNMILLHKKYLRDWSRVITSPNNTQ